MMQANALLECVITNLGHEGEGVGQIDGRTVFVPGALPGERVRVRIVKVKSSYATAQLKDVLDASPDRQTPPCPIYEKCGGCQLQHGTYEAQLTWKYDRVVQTVRRIGKWDDQVRIHPVKGMDQPWHYRNKVQVPVGAGHRSGFYARGSHEIVPFDACLIQQPGSAELVQAIVREAALAGIPGYDEASGTGWLRHVLIRIADGSGQWMVVLVTRTAAWPDPRKQAALIRRIIELEPRVVSIYQNINSARTNVILGRETHLLWGESQITDDLTDRDDRQLKFGISPLAFYQVNTAQMKVLYDAAADFAALTGKEILVDAYCGIGTIALYLATRASFVYGVEIVEPAIADAKENAARNQISHVQFETGDAGEWMSRWYKQGVRPDVVVLDPPRKGCSTELLEAVDAMNPQRIVYVSCDVATFARDTAILKEKGWKLTDVQPVDLFPQTAHIEVVGLLIRA